MSSNNGYLSQSDLEQIYRAMRLKMVHFNTIQPLCSDWPHYLGMDPPMFQPDRAAYERSEEEYAACYPARDVRHRNMVILDQDGYVLLDGYEAFNHYRCMVYFGEMPGEWKMWVIDMDETLSVVQQKQLAIFLTFKRVNFFEYSNERNVISYIRAMSHFVDIHDVPIAMNETSSGVERISEIIDSLGEMCIRKICRKKIYNTACALLEHGHKYFYFLSLYQDELTKRQSAEYFLSLDLNEDLLLDVSAPWWYQESLEVQYLLTIVVWKMNKYRFDFVYTRNIRDQIIRIVREVVTVLEESVFRVVGSLQSLETLLLSRMHHGNMDFAFDWANAQPERELRYTVLFYIGDEVAKTIWEGIRIYVLHGDGSLEVPSDARIEQRAFEDLSARCLIITRYVLSANDIL